jgi:hypothetical protein
MAELRVTITLADDPDNQAIASLKRWLSRDPDVVHGALISTKRLGSTSGEMNAWFDAISALVSDGTALGSLIVAYQSWRDSRPQPPSATIECNGTVVHLFDSTPEKIEQIVIKLAGITEERNAQPTESQ